MVTYKNGDLLASDCNVICHQVNCQGVMGAGIAKAIREHYPKVFEVFRNSYEVGTNKLGKIDVVYIPEDRRFVVNLYSQFDYRPHGKLHTDYSAFFCCLLELRRELSDYPYYHKTENKKYKIGFPDHIGCGLAGGDWDIVKKIIEVVFAEESWDVEVWKLC